jgi:hypothetical protein
MTELFDIIQIGVGVSLFFLGKIVVTCGRKLWWTGLGIAVGGYLVVANVFGIM